MRHIMHFTSKWMHGVVAVVWEALLNRCEASLTSIMMIVGDAPRSSCMMPKRQRDGGLVEESFRSVEY
jgi:hypothetical protein